MSPVSKPYAVILDFDGVVVDSLALHLEAWNEAVQELFGVNLEHKAKAALSGHSTRIIASLLSRKYGDPRLAAALRACKERLLEERYGALKPMPGAIDFIAQACSMRLPLGIASNSSSRFVNGALAHLGISLATVLTAESVSRPKPAPDLFWACANQLGVGRSLRPEVTVYEDSPHGLRAANRASMFPVGVASHADAETLEHAGAKAVCKSLGEALDQGWLCKFPGT